MRQLTGGRRNETNEIPGIDVESVQNNYGNKLIPTSQPLCEQLAEETKFNVSVNFNSKQQISVFCLGGSY